MTQPNHRHLLVGLLDDELTTEERIAITDALRRDAALRAEYEELRHDQGRLEALSFDEPTDRALENLWRLPYSRATRTAGWLLVITGYAALIIYGIFVVLHDDGTGTFQMLTVGAIVIGFALLFVLVLLERLLSYNSDPYKEIER